MLPIGITSVTAGVPLVTVPVLSSTTILHLPQTSSADAVLKSIPRRAPTPLPTIIATGVARPNAHGQLITSTDIARAIAKPNVSPTINHTINVITAITNTTGTNTADTLSATRAIGAFVAEASLTIFTILARVLSSPTAVARHTSLLVLFIVPLDTRLPITLSDGMLSPVRADSSTTLLPSSTTPSTAKLSPGSTMKISSFKTSSAFTVISLPSFTSVTVFGANSNNDFIAFVVLPLA